MQKIIELISGSYRIVQNQQSINEKERLIKASLREIKAFP